MSKLLSLVVTAVLLSGCTLFQVPPTTTPPDTQPVVEEKPYVEPDVTIYLVALEDQGSTGKLIGCGDSLVPVKRAVEPTAPVLAATVEELLSIKEQTDPISGHYNALYQSQLTLEKAELIGMTANIYLTGQFASGGVCDDPRIIGQLEETVKGVPGVDEARFYLNGELIDLQEHFSGRGEMEGEPVVESAVTIYLVAMEDDGKLGKRIGCGDSLVPVKRAVEPTAPVLAATVEELLAVKEAIDPLTGYYNALQHSPTLTLEKAELVNGTAHVYLQGELRGGGTCDDPRIEEQLEQTVLDVPGVDSVQFYLNGEALDLRQYFSGSGE